MGRKKIIRGGYEEAIGRDGGRWRSEVREKKEKDKRGGEGGEEVRLGKEEGGVGRGNGGRENRRVG